MAKIIKCPKCGENVEIPPNAAGTVVKCGACGAGLRIKARPAPAAGGEQDRSQGSMSGSKTGSISGSLAGTIIGQTGYGQPAPQEPDPDAPPSLGSECAVCGRSVDPDDLVEDRGKLVCSKCAKRPAHRAGAAGAMAPALSAAPNFDPALRHGPMISIDGAFLAGCAALLIVGACQAFLYFNPKPEGTRRVVTANIAPVKPGATTTTQPVFPPVRWEDANRGEIIRRIEEARQISSNDPKGAIQKYDELLNTVVGDRKIEDEALKNMVDGVRAERANLQKQLETPTDTGPTATTMAAAPDTEAPPTAAPVDPDAPVQPEPVAEAPKPENIFELPPDTPELLQPALLALSRKNYQEAADVLERNKVRAGNQPSRDQRLTLETLAAANIGVGKYTLAEGQLKVASQSYASSGAKVTRSLVLNRAIAQLAGRKPPQDIAKDLQTYIQQTGGPPDEVTHAVLGTAVSRISPKVKERDELVNFLDQYTAQLDGSQAAAGKKRWGVSWADAEKVEAARKYVADINEQIRKLEPELDKWFTARENAGAFAKEALANANANYERVYGEIYSRKQALLPYQPKWLEKFEPVMPEIAPEESAAPPPPVDAPTAPPPPPVQPSRPEAPAPAPPPPPVP